MPQPYIDFAFVKEHASFEPVLAHYHLQLVGRGKDRAVLCPFHRDHKPSCKIDVDKRIFHCFACEAKGNMLEFVARMEGDPKGLRTAALKIAELCQIATAPPRERAQEARSEAEKKPERVPAAHRPAAGNDNVPAPAAKAAPVDNGQSARAPAGPEEPVNPPLTFALKLDPEHPYLRERGLSAELVALFGIGYCKRGVMAGRVCIPVHNERGELVAYAGRWPGEDVPEGEGKYKLPAKFEKSRVLFNLHRDGPGRAPGARRRLLVDHAAARLGRASCSPMGWSVSPEQVALLCDRGVRFLTLLLDGDDAGRRARERVVPDLASTFFVRAPLLPDGQKPDTVPEPELLELVRFPSA